MAYIILLIIACIILGTYFTVMYCLRKPEEVEEEEEEDLQDAFTTWLGEVISLLKEGETLKFFDWEAQDAFVNKKTPQEFVDYLKTKENDGTGKV